MKTVEDMSKDSLARRLYDRIKEGEERTINEWAIEFDTLPYAIQSALGRLRKVDCHLHPVGTVTNFKGESKRGVVVDVMNKEEWFTEVYERGMKLRVMPGIKDFYRKTDLALHVFPKLRQSLTVAFNTVFSYLKATHDIMRLPDPKVPELNGTIEDKQKILEDILEQVK